MEIDALWKIVYYTRMSFEDNFLRQVDFSRSHARRDDERAIRSRIELPPLIKTAHNRLKREVFSNQSYSIQAPEFSSIYGKENIIADMQKIATYRKQWEQQSSQEKNSKVLAEVLEGMILVNARENGWFGDSVTMKTSLFDDVFNKTDMFTEWHENTEGSRVLAMAVDITYGKTALSKKLQDIKTEIDSDRLGTIRYFKDTRGDFMGTRNNIPRTVIGISPEHTLAIASLWMKGDSDALQTHTTQRVLIEEMYVQTKAMADYAHFHNHKNATRAYEDALASIEKLRQQKESISIADQEPDTIAAELITQTKAIFG